MTDNSDELDLLIAKAASGNRAAMQSVLLHYHDLLLEHIRTSITGAATAWVTPEDVLQETMFEACRRIQALDHRGHEAFFAWLKTIARTRLLNMIEARRALKRGGGKSHVNPVLADTAASILQVLQGSDPTPSRIMQRKEALAATVRALARLEAPKRQLIELRFGQGLPIQDVAAQVGKNEGAVKMALARALEELRKLMDEDGEFTVSQ